MRRMRRKSLGPAATMRKPKTTVPAGQSAAIAPLNASSKKEANSRRGALTGRKEAETMVARPPSSAATGSSQGRAHPRIPLRNAVLAIDIGGMGLRFQLDAVQITLLASGRRPIRWRFTGSKGSVTFELPRREAWDLIEGMQEESIVAR